MTVGTSRRIKVDIREGWQPMDTAPRNATNIEVLMANGDVLVAHWAQDLSGECQPPFKGWFVKRAGGYGAYEIDTPKKWRPLNATNAPANKRDSVG